MSNLSGMPANIGTKDSPVWGVKMKQPANPGDIVAVVSKGGQPRGHKRLISVHKQWPDAVDWAAEDADSNGAGGGTGPGQFSPGPQSSGQAPSAPSATGPTGGGQPVTASSLVDAQLAVRARLQEAGCADEQAMASYANTIVIAIQKGAAPDLVDFDPFGG